MKNVNKNINTILNGLKIPLSAKMIPIYYSKVMNIIYSILEILFNVCVISYTLFMIIFYNLYALSLFTKAYLEQTGINLSNLSWSAWIKQIEIFKLSYLYFRSYCMFILYNHQSSNTINPFTKRKKSRQELEKEITK